MKQIHLKNFSIGKGQPLTILSGPCVIESEEHCLQAAETLKKICKRHQVNLVFKSSYDKANRSSVNSYRGPGLDEGLKIFEEIGDKRGIGWALKEIGNVYTGTGDYEKNVEYHNRALQIFEEIGYKRGIGNLRNDSSLQYKRIGDYDELQNRRY